MFSKKDVKKETIIGKDLMQSLEEGVMPTLDVTIPKVGQFTIKFPTGEDEMRQARIVASQLGGLPRSSYPADLLYGLERDTTLIVLIDEYPEDFPRTWRNDGLINYPKTEVKNALYNAFLEFRKEISEEIIKL